MSQPRAHILVGNIQHVRGLNLQDPNFALPVKTCANIMGCEIYSRKVCCAGIACSAAVLSHILRGKRATLPRGRPRIPDLSRLDSGTFPFGLTPIRDFSDLLPRISMFSPAPAPGIPDLFRSDSGPFPVGASLVVGVSCPPLLRRFAFLHSQFCIPPENNSSWRFRRSGQVGQGLPRVARVVGVSCVCGLPCLRLWFNVSTLALEIF